MVENFANVQGDKLVAVLPLIPSAGGGGGGGGGDTVNYNTQVNNKPKINDVTLSGNKSSADLSLLGTADIDTTTITLNASSKLQSSGQIEKNASVTTYDWVGTLAQYNTGRSNNTIPDTYVCYITDDYSTVDTVISDVQFNNVSIVTDHVANITDSNIRSVAPSCTIITASDTTATISGNSTYAHAVSSSGCVYTLVTPSSTSEYNGFILILDTTNSASVAFQTDATPAVSISINGNPTIETGKDYTVVGQYNVLKSAWNLWISEYNAGA